MLTKERTMLDRGNNYHAGLLGRGTYCVGLGCIMLTRRYMYIMAQPKASGTQR